MKLKNRNILDKYILYGIPLIIILGFPIHFLYEILGNNRIIGILCPINESIWEHLKLCFYPILIYWTMGYFILKRKATIDMNNWFTCCLISLLSYILLQVGLYYLYTASTGAHMLVLDILCMVAAVALSQGFALHIYNQTRSNTLCFYISLFLIAGLIFYFTICTFDPPRIPLFLDNITKTYGINKLH